MIDHSPTRPEYRIMPLQRLAQGGRWRTEAMRSYRQPVLYWFTRGQGRMTVHGVTRGYGPHNVVVLPAGTMHGFDIVGQVSGSVLHVPDDPDFGLPEEPLHLRLRDVQLQGEMAIQIENIQREINRGVDTIERALVHHVGLLCVWLERQAARQAGQGDGRAAERLATAYTALLERDFRHARTVADYAGDLGVTATHLSRACKSACGRNASALLQDRVHYEARQMLRDTALPVKDVARALGFRSAAYFTRAFQQQTGHTPTAFRRSG